MTTLTGPCDWPYDDTCPCDVEPSAEAVAMAGQWLWTWSGGRYGPCEVTVRPCGDPGVSCGRCGGAGYGLPRCGCRSVPEIVLPYPVYEVAEVIVDGVALPDDAYRVDDWSWLVRLDGNVWPFSVDMTAPLDAPGSFAVTYLLGFPPPLGTGAVTAELACEIHKALCGDSSCRLPRTMIRKTRTGVTIELQPGGTGIPIVDEWVRVATARSKVARVWSPDLPEPRHTTWAADPGSS